MNFRRILYLIGLMLAGESIYLLPYLRKTFQTSMEEVLVLTATEVGQLNAAFGLVALLSYFPGGYLADRFSARHLLCFSLLATGFSGISLWFLPEYSYLLALHIFWALSSILSFWGALIKATRLWAGPGSQGRAFGALDAGRGVVAAVLASLAAFLYTLTTDVTTAFRHVVLLYALAPIAAAPLLWWSMPRDSKVATGTAAVRIGQIIPLLRQYPGLIGLAVLIFLSYCMYVGSFEIPAYLERVHGVDKAAGARAGALRDWMRPIAAVGAGLLADRFRSTQIITPSFALLTASLLALALWPPGLLEGLTLWIPLIVLSLGVFALRAIYFVVLEEITLPREYTGLAVGFVSWIGFSPDIFAHWGAGAIIDHWSGPVGYRIYFSILAVMAIAGAAVSIWIGWRIKRKKSV